MVKIYIYIFIANVNIQYITQLTTIKVTTKRD